MIAANSRDTAAVQQLASDVALSYHVMHDNQEMVTVSLRHIRHAE